MISQLGIHSLVEIKSQSYEMGMPSVSSQHFVIVVDHNSGYVALVDANTIMTTLYLMPQWINGRTFP